MTWSSAKEAAKRAVAAMPLPPDIQGATIQLTDFEDEDVYRLIKGFDEWSLEFHRMVNSAVKRLLAKRGAKVEIVMVRGSDFYDWLAKHDLENTTANRAQFIGWLTAPEPKPKPI